MIFVCSVQQLKRRTITSALKVPGVPEMIVERPEIAASPTFCAKPVELPVKKWKPSWRSKYEYLVSIDVPVKANYLQVSAYVDEWKNHDRIDDTSPLTMKAKRQAEASDHHWQCASRIYKVELP